jgi:diacylglycerol diphosphate phosphatase/phosphatidate phosphatase
MEHILRRRRTPLNTHSLPRPIEGESTQVPCYNSWILHFVCTLASTSNADAHSQARIALTIFITDVVKNAVGRPRPDLISRCKPAPGTLSDKLVTIDVCTETDHHTLHDGWRSFPSGHSSFAFSGLGYLALFFAGQLHVFRPRTDLGRVLIALAPLLGAAMIAISRCEDYRHDVYDVTCGSILGMSIAYFSYRRYYPRLKSAKCDEPFPSRETSFNEGFGKLKNDEEATLRSARDFDVEDSDDGS